MNITLNQFVDDLIQMYNTNEDGLYLDASLSKYARIEKSIKKVSSLFLLDEENLQKITLMDNGEYVDFVNTCVWECPSLLSSYKMNYDDEFSNTLNRNLKGRKKFIEEAY